MQEGIERHRIFAGDDAIQHRAAAGGDRHDILLAQLLQKIQRLLLAHEIANAGDAHHRARERVGPGELALPFRIEQIGVSLRNLSRADDIGVVCDPDIAQPCWRPIALRAQIFLLIVDQRRRPKRPVDVGGTSRRFETDIFHDVNDEALRAGFGGGSSRTNCTLMYG